MPCPPSHPLLSSSSTLWAQASKEWIIPAKPKPGRKPKKEPPPPPQELEELDSKGRRVQNRAAQRAFRERKQSQLADLQARVQSYEQGEIERNVALQNVAKRLKDENDALRRENFALKDEISRLRKDGGVLHNGDRKRWREDSLSTSPSLPFESYSRKKLRTGTESPVSASQLSHCIAYLPSSPSIASSPESNHGSNTAFSPLPFIPPSRAQSVYPSQGPPSTASTFPQSVKSYEPGPSFDAFDCGLCNENTPCVCREIAMQQVAAGLASNERRPLKLENIEHKASIVSHSSHTINRNQLSPSPSSAPVSILDNLPAYQPPVPIRRTGSSNSHITPIFQIRLPSPEPSRKPPPTALCSGDPSNCMACADDAFGKAFCTALGDSVCSSSPCATCPTRTGQSVRTPSPTPGSPGAITLTPAPSSSHTLESASDHDTQETIPCSDAWRQLKSHPNIGFADLSMLADVVARRTKCTGPRVVISPALGSHNLERDSAPALPQTVEIPPSEPPASREDDSLPILLVDPHARYHEQLALSAPASPRALVPQEILRECSQRRVREVDADGVREALRILDAQFGRP